MNSEMSGPKRLHIQILVDLLSEEQRAQHRRSQRIERMNNGDINHAVLHTGVRCDESVVTILRRIGASYYESSLR